MKVDINKFREAIVFIREIDSVKLQDITWFDGQTTYQISDEHLEHWRFIGLSNSCYAEMNLI